MSNKNVEAIYSLSPPQQGMLFETVYAPESGIHVEQFTCALHGNLNLSAFEQGWQRIVERHSILRTGFVWKEQDEPLQVVLRRVEVPLEQQDWRGYQLPEQQEQLQAYLNADRSRGFNLSKPPLMRLALFQMGEDTYQFVWTYHHILMDGWCGPLVIKEFLSFYQAFSKGQDLQLKPICSYRNYIAWLKKQDLSQFEAFWRRTLQGFTKPTPLGIKAEPSSFSDSQEQYGEQNAYLSAPDTAALKSLAKANRLTLNTVVQGVWALLLSHYSSEEDVVFGITVSGRPSDLPGVESMIGLFINTLPLRVKVSPQEKLWFWLKDIQTYNFELRQYEHSHGGQVHEWSEVPGFLPLYESILVFENYPVNSAILQCSDFTINIRDARSIGAQTKYALTLLASADSELELKFVYDRRRLDSADVARILEHFLALLKSIISKPETEVLTLLNKIPADQIPKVRPLQKCERKELEKVYVAPRTPVEEVLAGIWAEILGLEFFGIDDNFFELGGHSLLATQVISRLREAFQVELPLSYLFESPTIARLAERIETTMRAGQGLEAPPILPVPRDGNVPLSFAQQRLWFLDRLDPGKLTYSIPTAVRLTGPLNVAALTRSVNEVVRRHEALRTRFTQIDGQPIQAIAPPTTFTLPAIDLRLPPTEREQKARRLAIEEAERPFDLAQGPLLRVTLLQLGEAEHVLLLTMHHIVSDLWSMGILIRELAALYEAFSTGKSSPLPELSIQYADFAVWQRQWLQGEVLETQLPYWKQQLGGASAVLELPTDRPRPLQPTSTGRNQSLVLPKDLSEALKSLSQRQGVTLFMSLLAAFNTLLYCYTQQEDILVGSPIANRNRAEIEGLIGFFINTLVMRTDLSGNPSFRELLGRVREVTLGAYAHQDLPFEKLVGELQLERNLNHNPLFQVWFTLQNISTADVRTPVPSLPGLTLSAFEIDSTTAPFDLALLLSESPEGISGCFEYKTDLFEAATIARMAEHFETLLRDVVAQPDVRLNQLVEIFNETNRQQQIAMEQEYQNTVSQKLMNIKRKSNRKAKT